MDRFTHKYSQIPIVSFHVIKRISHYFSNGTDIHVGQNVFLVLEQKTVKP